MKSQSLSKNDAQSLASEWCQEKGQGWELSKQLGVGGTAVVFEIQSPHGLQVLKIYDEKFSTGQLGNIERTRIDQQLRFNNHECPSLVRVYEGGLYKRRLFVLMSRAEGINLEKCLTKVPRSKIRSILHDITKACIFLRDQGVCHRDIKAANICVSKDFNHATLLDIAVIRDIHDPLGVGTDQDGQLPVVATARYTPPEYLFRLVEPGAALWHALNVYQLGALLHDLIVGAPIFQEEFNKTRTNRYRFAWVVATQNPSLAVFDVESDLIYLARRALDKNWERRSKMCLESFLNHPRLRKARALEMLGLKNSAEVRVKPTIQEDNKYLDEISGQLRDKLISHFRTKYHVTATHQVNANSSGDESRVIALHWIINDDSDPTTVNVSLRYKIHLLERNSNRRFEVNVELVKTRNGKNKIVAVTLPDILEQEYNPDLLFVQCTAAFEDLAEKLL